MNPEPYASNGRGNVTRISGATAVDAFDTSDDDPFPDGYAVVVRPPGTGARLLAAISYVSSFSLLIFITRPSRRFTLLHSRVALVLHVLRFLWVSGMLALWWQTGPRAEAPYTGSDFVADAGMMLVAGIPRTSTLGTDALPWIITPLAACWLLSLVGTILSLMGRTADFNAFAHADWSDVSSYWRGWRLSPEEERLQARRARARHVERLQRTTKVMGVERTRRERITVIQDNLTQLQAEYDHINQLLALGEISQRRYDILTADMAEEIANLRAEQGEISKRASTPRKMPTPMRVNRLDRAPESPVNTVAIVTPSGVPLFTYGTFALDEALVAGILSAFDSISEEVFGSRVHKTELAEGHVLHFAHGEHVVILAVFIEDPSPRQIEQLRSMLTTFEAANNGPLSRQQYDTQYLHQIHPPFEFQART
ncbi:MAG TPA: hypothetical protein VEX37_14850 [Thermomicrobiales bacterium]|nr:hypothetical protein [Thermomicrobiales bacterium]